MSDNLNALNIIILADLLTCHYFQLQFLLSSGVEIDHVDYGGSTPLHFAAQYGHLAVVKRLIEGGCDVNHGSKSGKTAVWKAAVAGHKMWSGLIRSYN